MGLHQPYRTSGKIPATTCLLEILEQLPAAGSPAADAPPALDRTTVRLVSWLLSDDVRVSTGPEAGGVFGWFDPECATRFIYPETTGYYLTFLAFLQAQHGTADCIPQLACQAAAWLQHWNSMPSPPTRVYVGGPYVLDWRNHFSFSFDLAMIRRGIAMARPLLGEACSASLCEAVTRRLSQFATAHGELLAAVSVQSGPQAHSWSLAPGPFQRKTAAALLGSGLDLPAPVRRAAEAMMTRFRGWIPPDYRRELLHPYLYAAEGALLMGVLAGDRELLRQSAAAIEVIAGCTAISRSDVLAQLLRATCLLHAAGYLKDENWNRRIPEWAAALGSYCAPDGRMYFARDTLGCLEHANVWSGLFAAQALIWYAQWRAAALPLESAVWLV